LVRGSSPLGVTTYDLKRTSVYIAGFFFSGPDTLSARTPFFALARTRARPRADDHTVLDGIWHVGWIGCPRKAVHREWFGVCRSTLEYYQNIDEDDLRAAGHLVPPGHEEKSWQDEAKENPAGKRLKSPRAAGM
jgi:hypothetical protein